MAGGQQQNQTVNKDKAEVINHLNSSVSYPRYVRWFWVGEFLFFSMAVIFDPAWPAQNLDLTRDTGQLFFQHLNFKRFQHVAAKAQRYGTFFVQIKFAGGNGEDRG